MIRMGRGNRESETNDYNTQQQSQPTNYYTNEASAAAVPTNRAVSESESMARDIKEGRLSGFVGHGTTLTGETNFHAMLRVDGHLIGTVSSENGTLIIGTNGQVDANITVAAAMINGAVNGDIVATEKLQLGRTARVLGNIQAPRLIIEEGAILEGGCSMLRARESEEELSEPEENYDEEQTVSTTSPGLPEDTSESAQAYLLPDDDQEFSDAAGV